MAVIDDISAYTQAFGVSLTLGAATVRAIVDKGYSGAQVGIAGMATTQPMLTLGTADVPEPVVGVSVTVDSVPYVVAEHRPDGTGLSVLLLEAA